MIFGTASLMLNSITGEKQNRVLEILMTSVTPTQMLTGKIVALGLTGLLQTVVWSSAGLLLLRISGQSLGLPASFQLPVSILVWGAVFFLLGYGLYGSLMAGRGRAGTESQGSHPGDHGDDHSDDRSVDVYQQPD